MVPGSEQVSPPVLDRNRRVGRLSGLQTRLILPYGLLTLVLAVIGTFVITRLVASSYRERFENQIYEASRVAADGIVRAERNHLETLRLISFTVGLPEAATRADADALNSLIYPLVVNSGQELVSVVDTRGQELLTLTYDPQTALVTRSRGSDLTGLEIVRRTLAGERDAQGDKFAQLAQTSAGSYLLTSAPLRGEDGSLAGALLAGTSLPVLTADIRAQALADVVLLLPDRAFLSASLPEPDGGFAGLVDALLVDGNFSNQPQSVRLYEREYQILVSPLTLRGAQQGWLGIALPGNFMVSPQATSRNLFSLIFALGTTAVILIGWLVSRSIARPILHLRSLSRAVADGDLNQSSGLTRSDEIGDLASAFDEMTRHLRERTAETARLYEETAQRNRELAQINERLKSTQTQLIQSEKLAAIGQLTAGIVHDVKNPLAVIMGMTEFLADEPDLSDTVRHGLRVMNESAVKGNRIVSDLLKFARQSAPELEARDLRETIQASLRLTDYLTRQAHVRVSVDLPDQPLTALYDAQQIEQVLINLIHNAIQAMPEEKVRAGLAELRIGLAQSGPSACLTVADTGAGIAPEHLGRIFDPFFTTKPEGEGTGLGLSVSYGIIACHKGQITVESETGSGTTFTILLPLDGAQASPLPGDPPGVPEAHPLDLPAEQTTPQPGAA